MGIAWTCEKCNAMVDGYVHRCKAALERALVATKGNVTQAARELELSRSHFHRLLVEHELLERAAELRLSSGQSKRIKEGPRAGGVLGSAGRPRKRPRQTAN